MPVEVYPPDLIFMTDYQVLRDVKSNEFRIILMLYAKCSRLSQGRAGETKRSIQNSIMTECKLFKKKIAIDFIKFYYYIINDLIV